MRRYRSKKLITVGFGVILTLLITLAALWLRDIHTNRMRLNALASEQLKTNLITTMRDSTHRRAISLQRLPYLSDPFDRDDEYLRFREMGSRFLKARDELFSMDLSEEEQTRWDEVREVMNEGGRIQQQVLQLIMDAQDMPAAIALAQEKLVATQDKFVNKISEILETQRIRVDTETELAKTQNQTTFTLLGLLLSVGLLLGWFTIFVVRRTGYTEHVLREQANIIRALYNVTSMSNVPLQTQITEMLKLGNSFLETTLGVINVFNLSKNEVQCIYAFPDEPQELPLGQTRPLEQTYCSLIVRELKPIAIANAANSHHRYQGYYRSEGIQTYIAAPLFINGALFGSVNFVAEKPRPNEFRETHLDILQMIASWIAVALQRQNAQEQLNTAKEAAEAANSTKSAFLANMSHELRTPLNAIIGYAELLFDNAQDKQDTHTVGDLAKIIKSGRHLLALIDDVLDLSKIEAGRMKLKLEPVTIRPILDEIATDLHLDLVKHDNQLTFDNPNPGLEVYADRLRVKQVLFNLISNANKFTNNGKIRLSIQEQEEGGAHWIVFEVNDNGIGMSKEKMDKVFIAFTQTNSTISKRYGGTGLGLAISRLFCQLMGGDIAVRSELGVGSTFTLRLPVAEAIPKSDAA